MSLLTYEAELVQYLQTEKRESSHQRPLSIVISRLHFLRFKNGLRKSLRLPWLTPVITQKTQLLLYWHLLRCRADIHHPET